MVGDGSDDTVLSRDDGDDTVRWLGMTVMTLYADCVQVEGSFEFGDSRDRVKHFAFDYCYDSAVDRSDNAEYASQELVSI